MIQIPRQQEGVLVQEKTQGEETKPETYPEEEEIEAEAANKADEKNRNYRDSCAHSGWHRRRRRRPPRMTCNHSSFESIMNVRHSR